MQDLVPSNGGENYEKGDLILHFFQNDRKLRKNDENH